ncbi:MAG: oligosaccharide flippase family protein [Planctomycetota bacterium]
MSDSTAGPTDSAGKTYGQTAIRGAKFAAVAAILSRLLSLGSQIVLGVLLLPEDFTLWALVLGCVAIFAVLRESSIHRVLIARKKEFDRLARPALYLVVGSNLLAITLIGALSPVFASYYEQPKLRDLLLLMCCAMFVGLGNSVYQVKVSLDLHFGFIAKTTTIVNFVRALTMIAVAAVWASPACFIVGYGASLFVEAVMYRHRAGKLPPTTEPVLGPMIEILRDGGWVMLGAIATALIMQGDFLVIGRMTTDDEQLLGFYTFGFQLSIAFASMLIGSLGRVLAPTFSHIIDDQPRLEKGVERSFRLLTLLSALSGCLLAVSAAPGLTLVWGEKWQAAIIVVQALSFATATRSISVIGNSLLEARGRWIIRTAILSADAIGTLLVAYIGCRLGGLTNIALCVGGYRWLVGIIATTVSLRAMGMSPMIFYRGASGPLAITGIAAALTLTLDYQFMAELPAAVRLAVVVAVFGGLAVGAFAVFMPARLKELVQVVGRGKKKPVAEDDRNSEPVEA